MLLCLDDEIKLMRSFKNKEIIVQCYNTIECKAYDNDYMMIIKHNDNNPIQFYSYYCDRIDMFILYSRLTGLRK